MPRGERPADGIMGLCFLSAIARHGPVGTPVQGARTSSTKPVPPEKRMADGKAGFKGMGFPVSGRLSGYVPSATNSPLPQDLAYHLPKGSDLVLQTHFHPVGKNAADARLLDTSSRLSQVGAADPLVEADLLKLLDNLPAMAKRADKNKDRVLDNGELETNGASFRAPATEEPINAVGGRYLTPSFQSTCVPLFPGTAISRSPSPSESAIRIYNPIPAFPRCTSCLANLSVSTFQS